MRLPLYQVDAFTDRLFAGNPAAVCPLETWLPDATLQAIAAENNLSETAFFLREGEGYALRWFTPKTEVELCGHATLASGFVVLRLLEPKLDRVAFATRKAGTLVVSRQDEAGGEALAMDFPSWPPLPIAGPADLAAALGKAPSRLFDGRGRTLALYESAADVVALAPDFPDVARLAPGGVIATARGSDGIDFVSRYFAPAHGIDEDPVTGSAHCVLTPFWAARLGRNRLRAQQVSARGGDLTCTLLGDRITIAGRAVLYLEGWITV